MNPEPCVACGRRTTQRSVGGEPTCSTLCRQLTGGAHVHLWGTLGRSENSPDVNDQCRRCNSRYGDLPVGIHDVDPDVYPKATPAP